MRDFDLFDEHERGIRENRRETVSVNKSRLLHVDDSKLTPAQFEAKRRATAAFVRQHDDYFGIDPEYLDEEAARRRLKI